MLSRPVKTAYLSPRQPHHTCCNGTQYPGFRRPSSLRFVNKLDLIHCANRILISSGSPKAGYHGPSPGLSGWRLGGARHKLLGFTCWRRYFPLRSRAVTQNGLLVWQGVKGSRLHLPVEGKLESLEGKWGLMENTENRSERNPLPVSLLATSNSLFFFICLLFFRHGIVCHVGPGPAGANQAAGAFCGGFCHFIDWDGWPFFVCGAWRKVKDSLSLHTDARGHSSLLLSVIWHQAKMLFASSPGTPAPRRFPAPFEHPSLSVLPFLPSVVHFDLEKTTSLAQWILLFFFTPCRSLPYPPTLVPSSFCALPRHYCASRQKGPRCLWTREERWSSIIDKSHLRGGQWPHFFFCRIHLQSFQMLQISCRPPLQVFWWPWETINKPLLFISSSVAVGFHPTTAKKHLFWMDAHLDVRVKNGGFQMCITVLCNKMLPEMYQIIPKMYFLAINGKKKKILFYEKPHTLHFIS